MNMEEAVAGNRIFLYAVLELIRRGKTEKIETIQNQLKCGIATYLYHKYQPEFHSLGFCTAYLEELDEHYKQWFGVSLGCEEKYICESNDGLYLLIKLELNNMT